MTTDNPPFRSLPRDERRVRIVMAAKRVFLDHGLDASSMDDVAARAGTTKPTVYAHFKSKDELFAAVVELIRGLFHGVLGTPAGYADEPVEAIALFCARFLELMCWRDPVGYQRVALAAAARSPELARSVHATLHGEARAALAAYLADRRLTPTPDRDADLLLAATTAGPILRHLFGVDAPADDRPAATDPVGARVDLDQIRATVRLVASRWGVTTPPGSGAPSG